MLAEIEELRGLKRGLLRLGLPPIGSSVLFAPVFAAYTKLYPEIDIQLVEHGSKRLEELLLAGEVELAASLLPVADSFEWQDVLCEPVVALMPASHPVNGDNGVSLREISGLPFILSRAALRSITSSSMRVGCTDIPLMSRCAQARSISSSSLWPPEWALASCQE